MAVLLASEPIFYGVKLAGAAYLVGLGVHSLRAALRGSSPAGPSAESGVTPPHLRPAAAFRQGVINNLGNPKMAVSFVSVLPQFASEGQGVFSALALLGVVFSSLTFVWLASYATAVSAVGALLRTPRVRRAIEAAAGVVLIGLGVRLAAEAR